MSESIYKVLLDSNLLREIQSYININYLLNICSLLLSNKKLCIQLKLSSEATTKYNEDEEFKRRIHQVVSDPKRQIQLNKYVEYIYIINS